MYKKGLFHDWVPKPAQLLLIFVLIVPLMTINGVYTSNSVDMYSGLGILSEDLSMAYYASTIGMIAIYPLIIRVKQYFKSKSLLLATFVSFAFLNFVCYTTDRAAVLVLANFILGAVKILGMIEIIVPIMYIVSPTGDRRKFYSVFYPLSIGLGMLSSYFTAEIAYAYTWQYANQFAIGLSLFAVLLVLIFCHDYYAGRRVPLYQIDWLSPVILSGALMLLNYVFAFGRFLNWFQSTDFQATLFGSAILMLWFIQRQFTLKRPFLNLEILHRKNVRGALLLIFLMGIFYSSSNLISAFTMSVLKYSSLTTAGFNNYMALGSFLGGGYCFFWFKKQKGFKGLVFIGFMAFIAYHVLLYFMFSPVIEYTYMFFPSVLKGIGMTVLYISIGAYAAQKLVITEIMSSASLLILVRSFIGPAFWGAVYSFALANGMMRHTAVLAGHMDGNDQLVVSRMAPTVSGAMAQGRSIEAAQALGTQTVWGAVQVQAALATAKEVFGYIIFAGVIVLLMVLFHSFGNPNLRRLVILRKRFWKRGRINEDDEMTAAVAP